MAASLDTIAVDENQIVRLSQVMVNNIYIGVGGNLTNPKQTVIDAIAALRQLEHIEVIASSSLYQSKPMGPQDQPDYVNAVVHIATSLTPLALLDKLQAVEQQFGRVRKAERWGARTLDLDMLLYGDSIISTERLQVPHYGMKQREFVLIPLAEIAPELQLPDGSSVTTLVKQINLNGMQKLAD